MLFMFYIKLCKSVNLEKRFCLLYNVYTDILYTNIYFKIQNKSLQTKESHWILVNVVKKYKKVFFKKNHLN